MSLIIRVLRHAKCSGKKAIESLLVNSNPATIMTDPDFADRTYVEPLVPEDTGKIIKKEKPDALLPTIGGQTALNLAVELAESGVLKRHTVELIGAKLPAIKKAENRELFKKAIADIGLEVPRSGIAHNMKEAWEVVEAIGFPAIIRPFFTLGGTGGGVVYNKEEFEELAGAGIEILLKARSYRGINNRMERIRV